MFLRAFICCLFFLQVPLFAGPTPLGSNGIITVPTAFLYEDGEIVFGYKYESPTFPHYRKEGSNRLPLKEPGLVAGFSFFPFLEISLRYNLEPFTDRLVNIRVQVLKEKKYRPALTVGLRDALAPLASVTESEDGSIVKTSYYSTFYLVSSKQFVFPMGNFAQELSVTIGGGYSDFEKSLFSHIHGIFGGVEWRPITSVPVSLIVDYDTKEFGFGVTTKLFNHFYGTVSTKEFKSFSFVVAGAVNLHGLKR